MKNKVLNYYEEYKLYMNIQNSDVIMPNINPVIVKDTDFTYEDLTRAEINAKEVYVGIYKVYVNSKLFSSTEHFTKTILFHEFTHIYDSVALSNQFEYKDFVILLGTYSEYHASQIEIIYNLGYKGICCIHKYDQNKLKVQNQDGKWILVHEDYLKPLSKAIDIINVPYNKYLNISAEDYYKNYFLFEKTIMYYLGKKNFENKFAKRPKPDLLNSECGIFAQYIRNIENSIKHKDYFSIIRYQKSMFDKYCSYFVCNDLK